MGERQKATDIKREKRLREMREGREKKEVRGRRKIGHKHFGIEAFFHPFTYYVLRLLQLHEAPDIVEIVSDFLARVVHFLRGVDVADDELEDPASIRVPCRPVQATLLGMGLLRVVQVQVGAVGDNDLEKRQTWRLA